MANDRKRYASFAWTIIGITLITGLVQIVMTEDFQIDRYLGCFYDGETQGDAQSGFSNATLTIDMCIQHCRDSFISIFFFFKRYWSYAILQNGTDCRCSNDYGGRQVSDSFCNRACGGNVQHNCGGTYENGNSTYVLYAVCPIGTYGRMCDEACHCKRQVPCDRDTGRCPDGCHGNYTRAQCDVLNSFSDQYIGCYRDNYYDRAMKDIHYAYNDTLQRCLDVCFSKYSYAGSQYRGECWCGESYDKHGRIGERHCNSSCPGNRSQICGGALAISVYGKCPTGYYGPECAKICNCEGRCHLKNGTCLKTGCKPGWTGDTCSIRDCQNNNGNCASYEACIVVEPIASLPMSVCRCKSGYWRNQAWGDCADINECSEIPNICGSFAISCNNTEGGYTCHCMNGNVFQNSVCKPDSNTHVNNVGTVVGAVVGSLLFLIAVIIIMGILYNRKRERHHDKSNAALTVSGVRKDEGKLTVPEISRNHDNATNPESEEESAYAVLGDRTPDDNRVYDVIHIRANKKRR